MKLRRKKQYKYLGREGLNHRGTIFSIGGKVTDPDIKKGKGEKALFHAGMGFEIDVDNYLFGFTRA
jgi:hypothetical protein